MEIFSDLSYLLKFVVIFAFVLALIAVSLWLVRRFGAARLAGGRGRQPRLAVIDAASVDGRRKLIIIRRDNVEHLLMIGGPTDVVVETNIVRAGAVQRETTATRGAESLPRAATLPETPNWPQPEPMIAPRPERARPAIEESAPTLTTPAPSSPPLRAVPEPPRPAANADPLLGLAAELSRPKPEITPRPPEPPRIPLTAGQGNGDAPPATPLVTPIAPAAAPKPTVTPMTPATPAAAAPPSVAPLTPDAHLAEMAQRLENALKRPLSSQAARNEAGGPPPEVKRPEAKTLQFPEVKPASSSNGPTQIKSGNGAPARSVYEDLEQEMASLLGRQSGKS
ncbi:MAG TPA: flagellar biosynthesis protein FliO [Xanthobacteraceae bacterium]|nr:flagellar biosynthesis protein FliO [Xanthobacteraceae bacterium]